MWDEPLNKKLINENFWNVARFRIKIIKSNNSFSEEKNLKLWNFFT